RLLRRARPATFVGCVELRVEVQRPDLPDAVLLHVVVLVDAFAPVSAGAFAVDAALDDAAPPALRGLAVARERDDRRELEVIHDLAGAQARLAAREAVEIFPDVRLAGVDAVQAELDRAVLREEGGDVIPHRLVEVVTKDALQIA